MQGCAPSPWKTAKVIALYKGKGDKLLARSHRSISLTSVACKIPERIMVRSLTAYLETGNCRLDGSQLDFWQGRFTVKNLRESDARIADFLNSNIPCDLITFDFSHAFDKVDYKFIRDKLKLAGIDGC